TNTKMVLLQVSLSKPWLKQLVSHFRYFGASKTTISKQVIRRINHDCFWVRNHIRNFVIPDFSTTRKLSINYISGFLLEWGWGRVFGEYFREQNRPNLGYSRIYPSGSNYFLKVMMTSGEGMAEGGVGNYSIENKMHDVPSVWEHSERRQVDIGPPMGLLLFDIEENKIIFPSAHGHQSCGSVKNPKTLNIDKEFVVGIYSRTGKRPPQPYIKKIKEIIDECMP
ncbi:MAG TPA: hypothetical protein VJR67_02645, partial [Candidatus Nitrosopolaris sp.]|nr:hypothetical protein [Candidatus Nitrosopolaris sp.]